MNEYISREAAETIIERLRDKCGNDEMSFALNWASRRIRDTPAADVVTVVHCRECEHWQTDWEPNYSRGDEYFCAVACKVTGGHFYCADGERKKET